MTVWSKPYRIFKRFHLYLFTDLEILNLTHFNIVDSKSILQVLTAVQHARWFDETANYTKYELLGSYIQFLYVFI